MGRKQPLNTRKKLNRLRAAQRDSARAADKQEAREVRARERSGRKADSAMKGCEDR